MRVVPLHLNIQNTWPQLSVCLSILCPFCISCHRPVRFSNNQEREKSLLHASAYFFFFLFLFHGYNIFFYFFMSINDMFVLLFSSAHYIICFICVFVSFLACLSACFSWEPFLNVSWPFSVHSYLKIRH
jgi:hypothetical protein